MTTLNRLKLACALIGIAIFAAGIRLSESRLRVIGIGFVAVAWILRFARGRTPTDKGSADRAGPGSADGADH